MFRSARLWLGFFGLICATAVAILFYTHFRPNPTLPRRVQLAKGLRGTALYLHFFGDEFARTLLSVRPGAHLVEFGGRDGHFALELLGLEPIANATFAAKYGRKLKIGPPNFSLVSIGPDAKLDVAKIKKASLSSASVLQDHFEIFYGEKLAMMDPKQLIERFGGADLGADLWGEMSRTRAPSESLHAIHTILKPGAPYFMLSGRNNETNVFVDLKNGNRVPLAKFMIGHLRGFDVEAVDVDSDRVPISFLVLRKNKSPFSFPKLKLDRVEKMTRNGFEIKRRFFRVL